MIYFSILYFFKIFIIFIHFYILTLNNINFLFVKESIFLHNKWKKLYTTYLFFFSALFQLSKLVTKGKIRVDNFLYIHTKLFKKNPIPNQNYDESLAAMLPFFPKVVVEGKTITIIWNIDNIEIWGNEENESSAIEIGHEMELELKSTSYVKELLFTSLCSIYENLLNMGVSDKIARNALHDGHMAILNIILQFEKMTTGGKMELIELNKKR